MTKLFLFGLFPLLVLSCSDGEEVRSYWEEKSPIEKTKEMAEKMNGPETGSLTWKTPSDWIEEKGSGLRRAFFIVPSHDDRLICTLVVLKGDGGGLKANVKRWMGQLRFSPDSEKDLDNFISGLHKFRTSGGFPAVFLDFTSLGAESESVSLLVSMVNLPGETVFIKMMNKKSTLLEKRADFFAFSQTLRMEFSDETATR